MICLVRCNEPKVTPLQKTYDRLSSTTQRRALQKKCTFAFSLWNSAEKEIKIDRYTSLRRKNYSFGLDVVSSYNDERRSKEVFLDINKSLTLSFAATHKKDFRLKEDGVRRTLYLTFHALIPSPPCLHTCQQILRNFFEKCT